MKLLLLLSFSLLMASCATYHHDGEYYDDSRYGYNPYGGYRQVTPGFIGRFGVYREGHRNLYRGDHERQEHFHNRGEHEGRGNHGERSRWRGERREGHGDRD